MHRRINSKTCQKKTMDISSNTKKDKTKKTTSPALSRWPRAHGHLTARARPSLRRAKRESEEMPVDGASLSMRLSAGDVKPDELSRIDQPQLVFAVLRKPCAWMRFEHSRNPP